MTSPDFMYPQPTDDELAAQQPWAVPAGRQAHSAVSPGPASADLKGWAHREGWANREREGRAHREGWAHREPSSVTGPGAAGPEANPSRLGRIALSLAIIAGAVSLISSFALGVTVGPAEVAHGSYFTDTPGWYRGLAVGLFGLQALCTAVGITALIMGVVAAVTSRGRLQGIIATAITLVAPLVSFAVFLVLSFAFA